MKELEEKFLKELQKFHNHSDIPYEPSIFYDDMAAKACALLCEAENARLLRDNEKLKNIIDCMEKDLTELTNQLKQMQ